MKTRKATTAEHENMPGQGDRRREERLPEP